MHQQEVSWFNIVVLTDGFEPGTPRQWARRTKYPKLEPKLVSVTSACRKI